MAKLIACPTCSHQVSNKALTCPSCGQKLQNSAGQSVRLGCAWIAALGLIWFIVSMFINPID